MDGEFLWRNEVFSAMASALLGGLLNRTKFQLPVLIFMKGNAGKLFKIKNKSFNKETSDVASQKAFASQRAVYVRNTASLPYYDLEFPNSVSAE